MSVYYLQGQSNSGNTTGLTGYFYPLYTNPSLIDGSYHVHTFIGLDNEVFYMPEGSINHAVTNPPTESYYGNYMYQEYATYNVTNTIISYTNISTAQSQPVIAIASNGRDFDPFNNNAANTESLRVEELIPGQLRGSSERFITLIKDYYEHLNTTGLPTYETNRIIDEHDIDKVSTKYLDGIQGEIAKNIPDSNVMDRVSLYKKIIQYYTLKGSEESITTFFRLFFDEIIEVSYPREKLFELSSGGWEKASDEYTRSLTASISFEDLGAEYNWTPFQIKNDNNIVLGAGNIIRVEETILFDTPPPINGLVIDLDSKKSLNIDDNTWDSTRLNKLLRGYFSQGATFNEFDKLVKLNGTSSYIDFGDIGENPAIPLDTGEHTFIIRSFPRFNKENTEIQPLFSLSKDYEDLHSHELFFNKTTGQIGRSFVDTNEIKIELDADGESYLFSNFIDETSIGLSSLEGAEYDHMNSFLSPLGRNYNGKWKQTLIPFNNKQVFVHENDPSLSLFTEDDLKFYQFDGDTFNGPNNLQVGQSIYGEAIYDHSGVNALSEDGFILAIGAAHNDGGGGTNSGSVRVYELSNASVGITQTAPSTSLTVILEEDPSSPNFVPEVGMVISGAGLPILGADDEIKIVSVSATFESPAGSGIYYQTYTLSAATEISLGDRLRIGPDANTWVQIGDDIDGEAYGDLLGSDISLNSAGNILAIGAPHKEGVQQLVDNIVYPNYIGTVKVYELISGNWTQRGSDIEGGVLDSKLGANVSLNGAGDRVAISSGAKPNVDYDIGTQERKALLLEDFNGFGGVYGHSHSAVTSFVFDNRTYTKTLTSTTPQGFGQYSWLNDDDLGHEIIVEGDTGESGTPAFSAWVNYETELITSGSNSGSYRNVQTHEFSRVTDGDGNTLPAYPWINIDGTLNSDISELSPNPVPTLVANGTSVTITAGAENEFNTSATHVYVSGASHQYDGLFEISSITSTAISYLRSGPTLTSNSYSLETGINPQFGEIDGAKHIGLRIPDRIANETFVLEYDGSAWNKIGAQGISILGSDPLAGNTVRLSDDGRTLLIGTHKIDDFGVSVMLVRAYYNEENTDVWNQLGDDLTFISAYDKNQVPLSLSNDGTKFAVGILGQLGGLDPDLSFKGQVKIYSLNSIGKWAEFGQTLEGENIGDMFGASVHLNTDGNVIAIGAPANDEGGRESGKVTAFAYSTSLRDWIKVGSDISGFNALDYAGSNVSINGNGTRVIVGAPGGDTGSANSNHGRVEAFQIALDSTISTFIHSQKNALNSGQSRFTIKSEDKVVYYSEWMSNADFATAEPFDIGIIWYKENKPGDKSLPVLPHCDHIKRSSSHLFTLHNRGYMSIFYKHGGTYTPWQDITIGDTTLYDEERLWNILDYAINGDYLILLDRPVNGASRLVIFKVDEYNRYNFYQTLSLNLPSTHLGSADFAHIKSNHSQIVVGTHTFNNVDIAQVIQVYNIGEDGRWSSEDYLNLPPVYSRNISSDLEFNINQNANNGEWLSTDKRCKFVSSSITKNPLSDTGIILKSPSTFIGDGLGFSPSNKFSLSLRFNAENLISDTNILKIGNITLRVVNNLLTQKRELQLSYQETGKTPWSVSLDKSNDDIILDENPLEIFSDEYFNSEILQEEWNNLTIEFTEDAANLISGLRYSLNGFKRSKSLEIITDRFDASSYSRHGITSQSSLTLYGNVAFSHLSLYNKGLNHTEFEAIERKLSSNYTQSITTGINSLLDGGKFELSESGTIIVKVTDCGINIWEKVSATSWENYYNTIESVTSVGSDIINESDNYITHNGSRLYSYKFFGDELLIVNGGLNNAKEFVNQYNFSDVYNKSQHNSVPKLYYIRSQFTASRSSWKLNSVFSPTEQFIQTNEEQFKVGLNYGVNIAVDNDNDMFAVSLEPDSVNKILNGPNSEFFTTANSTNVKYDIWKKISDNTIRSIPYIKPDEGFDVVSSYGGRLDSSGVLKIVDRPPSYSAAFAFPSIIYSTTTEKPIIEYNYDQEGNPIGFYKSINEYILDFVISTPSAEAVYADSGSPIKTASVNRFNTIVVKGKADRYNGYVDIAVSNDSEEELVFERIIEGNTIRHLTISPEANFIIGRNGSGYYNGDISHIQYYTEDLNIYSAERARTYFENNVKKFYKIVFDKIEGATAGATKITSMPDAAKNFTLDNLDGHAFNSFLIFDAPEMRYPEDENDKQNTAIRLTVDYGNGNIDREEVYWGDGRTDTIINKAQTSHQYTLDYVGKYYNKKGRASSVNRIQDSIFWQKFSYNIRSGLKISDWESTFLNLVHPAGLRFFASVMLLVIRDNHWYGPKFIQFNPVTRENDNLLKVEDKFLSPFRTTQPLEDMRWLESLTSQSETGGYHMPMFQPGWLQGDIRVREFIFEAGLWTKLARSVPGNNLASKYTYSYFEDGLDTGDIEFRIQSYTGAAFEVGDVIVQGIAEVDVDDPNSPQRLLPQKRGIISTIAADGNEFTGIIKAIGGFTSIEDGTIESVDSPSKTATIIAVKVKRKDETISVFGTEEQDAAYLLQDRSTEDVNSEMFMRAVLTTFKYVIPSLVPQKEFSKRDYEQNLKFKDIDDISSYLPITIKDALDNSDVFMNVGSLIRKRNQLDTEANEGIFLERDSSPFIEGDAGLLIDDLVDNWWNDPTRDDDISAPVQLNVASYTGPQIQHGDTVYQDIVDNDGNNLIIEGLVVGTLNSKNSILVGWRNAINTSASPDLTLPSTPELDQLFRDGTIYTIQGQYDSPMPTSPVGIAKITEATITINT